MSVEHGHPTLGWNNRFETIFSGAKIMEIQSSSSSVIIAESSLKSALNDWVVEFHNPNIFPVVVEKYFLNNTGVIYTGFIGGHNDLPANYVRYKSIECIEDTNRKAELLIKYLERELSNASLILKNGRAVQY